MPKRTSKHTDFSVLYSGGYRYGFNSLSRNMFSKYFVSKKCCSKTIVGRMESDSEVKGKGNSYDFGARIMDPGVGRWLIRDALGNNYPNLSPYNYTRNNPIFFIDPDGNKIVPYGNKEDRDKFVAQLAKSTSLTVYYDYVENINKCVLN